MDTIDSRAHHRMPARSCAGLSLVELLVATVITLIGLLVITQVFAVYEGWKRTTTGVAQTQESGLLGAFAIEQDLRNAGFGMVGAGCAQISAYHRNATPSNTFVLSQNGAGVNIAEDGDNVRLDVVYSSSPSANVPARIQVVMAPETEQLYVDNGIGFSVGDLILITDGVSCSVRQISEKLPDQATPNATSAGNSTLLKIASGGQPWNPASDEAFPVSGYVQGTRVLNLGKVISHSFYVREHTLRMDERDPESGSVTSYELVSGVFGLRAQCLPEPCNDKTSAVRLGIVVQSGIRQKDVVSQAEVSVVGSSGSIAYWPGEDAPTLALDEEMRHYRYRVFHTIVPLKNAIWNP